MSAVAELDQLFSALADPVRRSILEQLSRGDATVGELAAPHPISQPAISRHLRVLQQAGLVKQTAAAQWRHNRLQTESLESARTWMNDLTTAWSERLDRLEDHLTEGNAP